MEKDNRYYGIIESMVKTHKKYNGYDAILDDIIDDIYKHAKTVISTVKDEDVILSYLQKLTSVSIITVPKNLNFHTELKHRVISTEIPNTIQPAQEQNVTKFVQPAIPEAHEKVQKANTEFVDKMINSIDSASITNSPIESTLPEHETLIDITEDNIEILEPVDNVLEEEITEVKEQTEEIIVSDDNVESLEPVGENDTDIEPITEEVLKEEIEPNTEEFIETTEPEENILEASDSELLEPVEDTLEENDTDIEPLVKEGIEPITEEFIETTEPEENILEASDSELLEPVEDTLEENDTDIEPPVEEEIEPITEEFAETTEPEENVLEASDSELLEPVEDTLEENDTGIELIENIIEEDNVESIEPTTEEDFEVTESEYITEENDTENLEPLTDDIFEEDNIESQEEIIEDDDTEILELVSEDTFENNDTIEPEDNNIEITNTNNEESIFELQPNTESFDIEPDSLDSEITLLENSSYDMENFEPEQSVDILDSEESEFEDNFDLTESADLELIEQETSDDTIEQSDESKKTHSYKPVDYSMFDYVPDVHDENVNIQDIETKLSNLNFQKPELNILAIFDLKYKQNLPIPEIAEELQMEKQDVIKALDEIVELI